MNVMSSVMMCIKNLASNTKSPYLFITARKLRTMCGIDHPAVPTILEQLMRQGLLTFVRHTSRGKLYMAAKEVWLEITPW